MWYVCLSLLLVFNTKLSCGMFRSEVELLTDSFFSSLIIDPFLERNDFSKNSKLFIDEKVENYVNLIKSKYGTKHTLQRRSIAMKNRNEKQEGKYKIDQFKLLDVVENASYQDFDLIEIDDQLYGASLRNCRNDEVKLGLYKYNGTIFNLISEVNANFAKKLYTLTNSFGNFIITTEQENINIFKLDDEKLKNVQTLNVTFAIDIHFWENTHGFFMGIARSRSAKKENLSYVYKWLGLHFDQINKLITSGATSMMAFTVGNDEFLAVANSEDDNGQTEIYSTLFKYDLDAEKYEIHQKILSNRAVDITFSSFIYNEIRENYLIVINSRPHFDAEPNQDVSIIYKYVDNYFIPFQPLGLTQPQQALIMVTPGNETLLAISTKLDGIKMYAYDGWIFSEVDTVYDAPALESNITSMKYYTLKERQILLIQNYDKVRIFEIKYKHTTEEKSFEVDTLEWCQETLTEISSENKKKMLQLARPGEISLDRVEKAARTSNNETVVGDSIFFDFTNSDLEKLDSMSEDLDQKLKATKEMSDRIDSLLSSNKDRFILNGDVFADKVIVNNDIIFKDLRTKNINTFDVGKMFKNKIDLNEEMDTNDELNFESVKINNIPKSLNDHDINKLLHIHDDITADKMIVDGDVLIKNNLNITGRLNDLKINISHLLLKNRDQALDGEFKINNLMVNNNTLKVTTISKLNNLRVKKLNLNGFINKVNVSLISKNALKIHGDQIITAGYNFDTLKVDDVIVNGTVSKININGIIKIDDGNYIMKGNIKFLNHLNLDKLIVETKLNELKVQKGKLNILRKKSQHKTGGNTFEKPILEINSSTRMFERELTVTGNFTIEGDVTIKEQMKTRDAKSPLNFFSFGDIENEALRLSNTEIKNPISFRQNVIANNIDAEVINDMQTSSFVINGMKTVQEISASITINSDVLIAGSTNISNLNNILLEEFEKNTLKIDGDQILSGHYKIAELTANSVESQYAKLGNKSWEDVMKNTENNTYNGTTTFHSLKINKPKVENLTPHSINGVRISKLFGNATDKEENRIAEKKIRKLTVDNLHVEHGLNLDSVPKFLESAKLEFVILDDTILQDGVSMEVLDVKGAINDMDGEQFKKNWLEEVRDREFEEEYTFDKVNIFGESTIESNKINYLDLDDLVEDTVKVTDDFKFNEVEFGNLVFSLAPITLHGDIDGLDLESTVTTGEQLVTGLKTFKHNVFINGSLNINGTLNGLDYSKLCEYSSTEEDLRYNLTINGSAIFTKGPELVVANKVTLDEAMDNLWMSDQEATLKGYFEFKNVDFEGDVYVEGLVDGVDLDNFSKNYFSKSKNQTVLSHLDFTDGIKCFDGIATPIISANELISSNMATGIDLSEFIRTAVLDGYDQVFEHVPYVDSMEVHELYGDYLVNGLNLQKDVMRYDTNNTVTGQKNISNVAIDNLTVDKNILIQGVDLLKWIRESIRKNGSGSIEDLCTFYNSVEFSKGLTVSGNVNGAPFNNKTILLKSEEQMIAGKKSINVPQNQKLFFKNIQLDGLLNGVEMKSFLKDQVTWDMEKVVLKYPVNINNEVSSENLEIRKLHNNVNVTSFLKNLTTYNFENYQKNFAQLLRVSREVERTLMDLPTYLDHYEQLQHIDNVRFSNFQSDDILVIKNPVYSTCEKERYSWDGNQYLFMISDYGATCFNYFQLLWDDLYIFIEDHDFGYVFHNSDLTTPQLKLSSNVKFLHSLIIEETEERCIVFTSSEIFCQSSGVDFYRKQQFGIPIVQVNSLQIDGEVFLITAASKLHNIGWQSTEDDCVSVWKYNSKSQMFNITQKIYLASPSSLSTASYKNTHYLAIASSRLEDAIYSGVVQIRRFDPYSGKFISIQTIDIESPKHVYFAILSSGELVLYVLAETVTNSFLVYTYEGLFGFTEKVSANINGKNMFHKNINGEHLILIHGEQLKILRAIFKSQSYK